ncbi:AraC family transcriptional regulator [Aquabacterium sp.]|uniref:AraC family transcriptional regulator n=1 Tax=Aquabacterium sp. TaxID=1872578 RepID=UPI0025C6290A|nr:AraC family transcriptional regulator [Aquabacterium sp.]
MARQPALSASLQPTLGAHRRLMAGLIPEAGFHAAPLDGVTFMRADANTTPAPVLQEPSIVLLGQGLKRSYLDGEVLAYAPGEILVVALPMQFDCDTVVQPGQPMLALSVRIDMAVVAELACQMDPLPPLPPGAPSAHARGLSVAPMDAALADALTRLLEVLGDAEASRVLGPQLLRELHYRVLQGPAGTGLRALAASQGRLGRVFRSIEQMRADPARELSVAALARDAGMSVSAFHEAFKRVTGHAPLQYLKLTRLHLARSWMLDHDLGAAEAAYRVGYGSASQFSREFKRLFGLPPSAARSQPVVPA